MSHAPTVGERGSRELRIFFIFTFALSWLVWVPTALVSHGWISDGLSSGAYVGLLGAAAPSLSAVIVSAIAQGRSGVGKLLRRILVWRVPPRWYLFALFWPPLLSLTGSLSYGLLGGALPDFGSPPVLEYYPLPRELEEVGPWPLLPFVFLQNLFVGSAMGEELGWRGFALPRLQVGMSALSASLLLGLVWGIWHLPLYLTSGHPMAQVSFVWTLLGILADSVLFTWVFNSTRGSLLPALVFHASIATTALFLPSAQGASVAGLVFKWLIVLAIVLKAGPKSLTLDSQSSKVSA